MSIWSIAVDDRSGPIKVIEVSAPRGAQGLQGPPDPFGAVNAAQIEALRVAAQLPQAADFRNKAGYAKAHSSTGSYAPNVVETEDANGLTVAAGAGLSLQVASAVRMTYDMAVGDMLVLEGLVVSGSPGGNLGPFIGVDQVGSGDFSAANLNMVVWRNAAAAAGLYGGNGYGAANATYNPAPPATSQPAPWVTGDLLRMEARILFGRQVNYRCFKNGAKVAEATQATAFPAGKVVMGFLVDKNITIRITKASRQGFSGQTVYVDGSVPAGGNGNYFAPFKTVFDARNAAYAYGHKKCQIYMLTGTTGDALIADDALFGEYELTGPLGWCRLEAAETATGFVSMGGASPDVYVKANKNLAGIANSSNAGGGLCDRARPQPDPGRLVQPGEHQHRLLRRPAC